MLDKTDCKLLISEPNKTEFELVMSESYYHLCGTMSIMGKYAPSVDIIISDDATRTIAHAHISDNDLEDFAVNILRALKSDKLK